MLRNAPWIFGFTIVLLAVFVPSYAKMRELKIKNLQLARVIEALQARNAYLEEERRLLQTDPAYLEKVARRKMGLIRDGEKVYRIVPAKKPTHK